MKIPTLLATLILLVPSLPAEEAKADFPQAGFSITPLDSKPSGAMAQVVATFLLPGDGGFSPNVNVMMFAHHKDLDGFVAITRKEFTEMKAKIVKENQPDKNTWVVEYTAAQEDKEVHFYARAEFKADRIYLATATALGGSWEKNATALKACVDSLKLK